MPTLDASNSTRRAADRGCRRTPGRVRLEAGGWTILARQLRLGRDEIDLLAFEVDAREVARLTPHHTRANCVGVGRLHRSRRRD
jgi:hypothetical protein